MKPVNVNDETAIELTPQELHSYVPKFIWLRERLRKRIQRMQISEALPTFVELQQEYNVSRQTVDRAIQALRTEGYLESRRGSGVFVTKFAKQKQIGLVTGFDLFGSDESHFFTSVWRHIQRLADEHCFTIHYFLLDSSEQSGSVIENVQTGIAAGTLDGLFFMGGTQLTRDIVPPAHAQRQEHRCPCVLLTNSSNFPYTVNIDEEQMVVMALDAARRTGRTNVALCMHHKYQYLLENPSGGSAASLAACDLATRPEWVNLYAESPSLYMAGSRFLQQLVKLSERPELIISLDDNATRGILHAAEILGVRIPEDLAIVTHANHGINLFGTVPLVRIEFDPEQVAAAMLSLMQAAVNDEHLPSQHIRLAPCMVSTQLEHTSE